MDPKDDVFTENEVVYFKHSEMMFLGILRPLADYSQDVSLEYVIVDYVADSFQSYIVPLCNVFKWSGRHTLPRARLQKFPAAEYLFYLADKAVAFNVKIEFLKQKGMIASQTIFREGDRTRRQYQVFEFQQLPNTDLDAARKDVMVPLGYLRLDRNVWKFEMANVLRGKNENFYKGEPVLCYRDGVIFAAYLMNCAEKVGCAQVIDVFMNMHRYVRSNMVFKMSAFAEIQRSIRGLCCNKRCGSVQKMLGFSLFIELYIPARDYSCRELLFTTTTENHTTSMDSTVDILFEKSLPPLADLSGSSERPEKPKKLADVCEMYPKNEIPKGRVRCKHEPCRSDFIYVRTGRSTRVHRLKFHPETFVELCGYCGRMYDTSLGLSIHKSSCVERRKQFCNVNTFWSHITSLTDVMIKKGGFNEEYVSIMKKYAVDELTRDTKRKIYLRDRSIYC